MTLSKGKITTLIVPVRRQVPPSGRYGHTVRIPDLPDPSAPEPEAWLKTLGAAADPAEAGDTVLVGHSLGGVNVLRLLQQHDTDRFQRPWRHRK